MPSTPNPSMVFQQAIADHISVVQLIAAQQAVLERIAGEMTRAIFEGNKVLWCGNGGSAADSQHMAAELMEMCIRDSRDIKQQ